MALRTDDGCGPLPALQAYDAVTTNRFFRWSGSPPSAVAPAAGGDVDGVSLAGSLVRIALPGQPFKVMAGGSFNAGASLATDGIGRAVQASAGAVAVARALEAGSAGNVVWAVFTSGRI